MSGQMPPQHQHQDSDKISAAHIADFASKVAPKDSFKRAHSDISCGRFSIGSHQSEFGGSLDATLILSDRSHGTLHAAFSGAETEAVIRPGALTFVPAAFDQTYDFNGETTNTVLAINSGLFDRVAETSPELGSVGQFEPRVPFIRPRLHQLIEEHYRIMASGEAGWRVLTEANALSIAYELFLAFSGRDVQQAGAPPLTQAELGQLIDFIEAELENNFDLTDLAEVLGRNPFGFSRSFRAATGESPHQFVIQRRISKAKELLEHTDDPLAEIAYATGFSNQSHMTATFSKHLGTPPGAYRKAMRG